MGKVGQNTVLLNNGIIEVTQVGDQTTETIMGMADEIGRVGKNLVSPVILVDMSNNGRADFGARQAGKKVAEELDFKKMAFVKMSLFEKTVLKLIGSVANRSVALEFFDSDEEARKWLKQ